MHQICWYPFIHLSEDSVIFLPLYCYSCDVDNVWVIPLAWHAQRPHVGKFSKQGSTRLTRWVEKGGKVSVSCFAGCGTMQSITNPRGVNYRTNQTKLHYLLQLIHLGN